MSVGEMSMLSTNQTLMESVQFIVYGICEPGPEIKVQLIDVLKKRLDDETLVLLKRDLNRNPKLKMTPQDVEVGKNTLRGHVNLGNAK